MADVYFRREIKVNIPAWRCDLWFVLVLSGVMTGFSTAYGLWQGVLSAGAFVLMLNVRSVFGLPIQKQQSCLVRLAIAFILLHGIVITTTLSVARLGGIKWVESNYLVRYL